MHSILPGAIGFEESDRGFLCARSLLGSWARQRLALENVVIPGRDKHMTPPGIVVSENLEHLNPATLEFPFNLMRHSIMRHQATMRRILHVSMLEPECAMNHCSKEAPRGLPKCCHQSNC